MPENARKVEKWSQKYNKETTKPIKSLTPLYEPGLKNVTGVPSETDI